MTTTAGRGSQYISEADGLSSLNLNAGSGSITLTLKNGSLADPDSAVDLTGSTVTVTMSGAQAGDFGSTTSPIGTSADRLFVDTSAKNGNQFITEANGITGLGLEAGTGNVTLDVVTGGILRLLSIPSSPPPKQASRSAILRRMIGHRHLTDFHLGQRHIDQHGSRRRQSIHSPPHRSDRD